MQANRRMLKKIKAERYSRYNKPKIQNWILNFNMNSRFY